MSGYRRVTHYYGDDCDPPHVPPISDEEFERLADEAERGYCVQRESNDVLCGKPLPCPVHTEGE